MLRRIRKWIADVRWWLVSAGVLLAIAWTTLSPTYIACADQQENQASTELKAYFLHKPGVVFYCERVYAESNNGAITALATVLLTFVTMILAWLAHEQGNSDRAQLRAYVSATARGITVEDISGDFITVFVEIKNSGQTPAFDIKIPSRIRVAPGSPHTFHVTGEISDAEAADLKPMTLPKDGTMVLARQGNINETTRIEIANSGDRFMCLG